MDIGKLRTDCKNKGISRVYDKLFDSGYISFNDDGNILISKELSDSDEIFMNVRSEMMIHQTDKSKGFMKYHRDNVFRG